MSLAVLGAVSDPGRAGRANEDGFGTEGRFAWVIDGATGLGDEALLDAPSDAAWLTAVLGEALAEGAARADDPLALLAAAEAVAERRFNAERRRAPRERYEIPTAAVLVARFGEAVDIVELGDCAIFLATGGGVVRFGGSEAGRAFERENARRTMGSGGGRTPEVTAMLRQVRNLANAPGGYPIFGPERGGVARARRYRQAGAAGEALLVTDGFEAAVEDYGLTDAAGLLAAARDGLEGPLAALRAVERDDPACVKFPRFKPSDDATALFLRFSSCQV